MMTFGSLKNLKDDLIELCESYKNRGPDSKFAHSEVFKVLSEEGATEARRICLELKKYAVQDQRNCKLRSDSLEACHSEGLYTGRTVRVKNLSLKSS